KSFKIDRDTVEQPQLPEETEHPVLEEVLTSLDYKHWRATNVIAQKQEGFFGVYIKVTKGDIETDLARKLVEAIRPFAADEI
ncbi:hypothetical protein, partial [Salmonella enterica]|uniref:hypothetical protein n=1 Tax=Salmonella enterica TaxID=28901 RepID=UPI0020C578D9